MRPITVLAAAIFLFLWLATVAAATSHAQITQCAPRGVIVSQLTTKHKEQQAAIGVVKDGRLLEVWLNPKIGTFTVMLTSPRMFSCIVATGSDYESRRIGEFVARFEY